jgi:hypothetical protein
LARDRDQDFNQGGNRWPTLNGLSGNRCSKAIRIPTDEALAVAVVIEHHLGPITLLAVSSDADAGFPHVRNLQLRWRKDDHEVIPIAAMSLAHLKVVSTIESTQLLEETLGGVIFPAATAPLLHVAVSQKRDRLDQVRIRCVGHRSKHAVPV